MGLWQGIKDAFSKTAKEGLYLPFAHDANREEPSVTLLFMYVFNLCALASIVYLHIKDSAFTAACTTLLYSIVWTVLYMMRSIQKAKFDLDDRSIDLEGDEEDEKPSDSTPPASGT